MSCRTSVWTIQTIAKPKKRNETMKHFKPLTIGLGLVLVLPALAAEEGALRSTVDALSFSVEPR
ncbi:MAG: hypothetical protein KDJ54_10315 [Candidatus Competibacteraceae bacterium]|nr:hypothetical protein [Candidatus Competibacteraceae bacterium]